MKRISRIIAWVFIIGGVGVGGYLLGWHQAEEAGYVTQAVQSAPELPSEEGLAQEDPRTRDRRIREMITYLSRSIKQNFLYEVTDAQLETGLYKGLFQSLGDPYSVFYTKDEYRRLLEDTAGEFAGVGIVVTADPTDNLLTIVSPIKGTPGDRAGLMAEDKIIAVDGTTYMATDQEEAVKHMRGEAGVPVTLTIQRKEEGMKTFDVTLVREIIHVESVHSQMLEGNIGYMQITSFDEPTAEEFQAQLAQLKESGAKSLILDLRNNPGGLLSSCTEIADALLGDAVIVTTRDKNGREEVVRSDEKKEEMPVVLLVNGGSASASEILTGALRDNGRAKAIGTKTFGKGIVQQIFPLGMEPDGGGYKITVAEYLTPNGEAIHGKGIVPDIEVELPEGVRAIGPEVLSDDVQLQRALQELGVSAMQEKEGK